MRRADVGILLLLSLIWGASFLFIKEALPDFSPAAVAGIRLLLGAVTLAPVVWLGKQSLEGWRDVWPALAVLAICNAVVPFVLINWGELYIATGLAAILNATTPLFTAPIAHVWAGARDRLTFGKLVGVAVGFLGVVVLLGVGEAAASRNALLGGGAVLIASLAYAFSSVFARRHLVGRPPLLGPVGQTVFGSLFLLPLTLTGLPHHPPGLKAVASLLALGILGTGFAYLLYFHLIRTTGATRAVLVTYLLPCTALLWGVLLLHERPGANAFAGLGLILLGVTLTLGLAAWPTARRSRARVDAA
jgi:drug/metabolite transporter (DMT)-like permease